MFEKFQLPFSKVLQDLDLIWSELFELFWLPSGPRGLVEAAFSSSGVA
jgi:hypothetical protein